MNGKSSGTLHYERLLFFSDAVFAIAITLLIIDIHLPEKLTTDAALQQALIALIPNYVGFLISFIVIGQFWVGHRRLFSLVRDCTRRTVFANMLLLFTIVFLPFPTAVLSAYGGARTGVLFYGAWLLCAGAANLFLVHPVHRSEEHLIAPLTADHHFDRIRAFLPILIALSGILAGLYYPPAGVAAFTFSQMILARIITLFRPKTVEQD